MADSAKIPMVLTPFCPACGYRCGCCCHDWCQTPCPSPDSDGECNCDQSCHGGHEPWDCHDWSTRFNWARERNFRKDNQQERP